VLAQLLEVVGPALAWDVAEPLGLVLDVGFDDVVRLELALGLGLTVELALSLVVPLALALPVLAEAVVLLVTVEVAEVAGAALDELTVADEQEEGVVVTVCPPEVTTITAPPLSALAPPAVLVGPAGVLGEPASPTDWNIGWRIDGTAASITPTANTAKPTAKAGRSMASRQSRGRGACRGLAGLARWAPGAVCPWRSTCQPRARAAFQRHSRSASTLTAAAMLRVSRNRPARA
jgi:hypothetical protein